MAPVLNLQIDQGTTFSTDITVNESDSSPLDLTGYSVTSEIRKHYHSSTITESFNTKLKDGIGRIDVTNPGSGYTSAPSVIISGDGTGASATAEISDGKVVSVTIDNPGSGYTSASIAFSGGGGSGATATALLEQQVGIVKLSLTDIQTSSITPGRYVYDVELVNPSNEVSRIVEGIVTIRPEVTKS